MTLLPKNGFEATGSFGLGEAPAEAEALLGIGDVEPLEPGLKDDTFGFKRLPPVGEVGCVVAGAPFGALGVGETAEEGACLAFAPLNGGIA